MAYLWSNFYLSSHRTTVQPFVDSVGVDEDSSLNYVKQGYTAGVKNQVTRAYAHMCFCLAQSTIPDIDSFALLLIYSGQMRHNWSDHEQKPVRDKTLIGNIPSTVTPPGVMNKMAMQVYPKHRKMPLLFTIHHLRNTAFYCIDYFCHIAHRIDGVLISSQFFTTQQ